MCTRGLGDCTPYTTTWTIVVRIYMNPHSSLTARTATSSRHDHPPSSDCSKPISPIGPPYLSVIAPAMPKCRSEPPKIRPFSSHPRLQSPPKRPHATLQMNVNLSPHSPHTHTAPHQRQLLHLVQRRAAPGGNLDSYYVRAIYAVLDVSGVRGDGYEDGEELTCARVKN